MNLYIKRLSSIDDIQPIEELQEKIWAYGRSDDQPLPYPARCLFEFAESGGLVSAAYRESRIIGFSAAWIGRLRGPDAHLYLHSQLLGVLPEHRDQNVGASLKLDQRQFAMSHDLDLICWTFDPLQTRNAALNLRKLGVIIRTFRPNYYGGLAGSQNQGAGTDRFWAEWHIRSPRVEARLRSDRNDPVIDPARTLNSVERTASHIRCIDIRFPQATTLFFEVPTNIHSLRHKYPELADHWQRQSRRVFARNLVNYTVADFLQVGARAYYVLSSDSVSDILSRAS